MRAVRYARFAPYPDYRVSRPGGAEVRAELERFRPTLVHVVSPTPMAVWAQRWARRAGVPVVASFHTHFVSYFRYYRVAPLEGLGWVPCAGSTAAASASSRPRGASSGAAQAWHRAVELWSRGMDLGAFSPRTATPPYASASACATTAPSSCWSAAW